MNSGVISANSQIIRALKRIPEEQADVRNILNSGSARLNKLQKLLWMTSASSPYEMRRHMVKKEPVNLETIMDEAADYQGSDIINAGISLHKAYNAENTVILGDPSLLFCIDINLISNALRHGDRKDITLGIEDEANVYRNYVRNSGGMELHGKDAFQDGVKGIGSSGLGMGLWATERYVRMLDGEIGMDTDRETFTQFNVSFKKP